MSTDIPTDMHINVLIDEPIGKPMNESIDEPADEPADMASTPIVEKGQISQSSTTVPSQGTATHPLPTQVPTIIPTTTLSSSSTALGSHENSRLLRLPLELRTMIWVLVLVSDSAFCPQVHGMFARVTEYDKMNKSYSEDLQPEKKLALARVCHSVYNEVRSIFYGKNTFKFLDTLGMFKYLSMIGLHNRRLIKNIEFTWGHGHSTVKDADASFKVLKECIFLEKLKCEVWVHTVPLRYDEKFDLWNAKGLKAFRKIRVMNPARFQLSIVESTRNTWGWLSIRRGFNQNQFDPFQKALQKEITEKCVVLKEEMAKDKIPEKIIPGRRWSARIQGLAKVDYGIAEESD